MSTLYRYFTRVVVYLTGILTLSLSFFSTIGCNKTLKDPDLSFVFAKLAAESVPTGFPFTLNMRIINDFYHKNDNSLPEEIKPASACHRAISCEFRADSAGFWQQVPIQDVKGNSFNEIVKPLKALEAGEITDYVEGIVCLQPGQYRFTIRIDYLAEVVERSEDNNLATDNGMLRSNLNSFRLIINSSGAPAAGPNSFLQLLN